MAETGSSFIGTKSLIIKFSCLPNSSIKNGYICLQCCDASNTSISCLCFTPEGRISAKVYGNLKNIQFDILRPAKSNRFAKIYNVNHHESLTSQIHGAGARLQAPTLSSPTNIKCCSKALPPNCISVSFILKAVTPLISMKKKKTSLIPKEENDVGCKNR